MIYHLSDYEYTLCILFADKSARSQRQIEFGNQNTSKRSLREIREDTLIGKMGEVAVAKMLREEYGVHVPVNYEIYPRGDWDDEDIIINGLTVDVKATEKGHCLLLEKNKVDFRIEQGLFPDMIIMCKTNVEEMTVDIVGCISSKRLVDPGNTRVKRLQEGRYIPGTKVPLQSDNYCVEFSDLTGIKEALDYIFSKKAV